MKKALLILFITSIGWDYIYGQNSIFFMPIWQQGETHSYSISEIKVKSKSSDEGKTFSTTSEDTSTYIAHFEILEVNDEFYRIKVNYENYIEDIVDKISIDSLQITIPEEYQDMDIIYTCDRNGEYQRIENVEEIQKNMKLLLDSILYPLAGDNAIILGAFGQLSQIYSSPEAIQTTAYKELQMLHFLYGSEMVEGYTYTMQELLPNILTGEPLRATTIIYIDTLNSTQSLCSVKRYSSVNEKDAKKIVKAFMNALKLSKAMKRLINKMSMSIADDYTFDFNTLLNMPVNINTKRFTTVTIGNEMNASIEELQINFIE